MIKSDNFYISDLILLVNGGFAGVPYPNKTHVRPTVTSRSWALFDCFNSVAIVLVGLSCRSNKKPQLDQCVYIIWEVCVEERWGKLHVY